MKVRTKHSIHEYILDSSSHQNLKADMVYFVIEITHDSYRVINERKEPILYPKYLFTVLDSSIPSSWIRNEFDDGEYFIGPPELNICGFYEDFFDGKTEAVSIFRNVLARETHT